MRSSALAGFLASAVLVSGSAGFASTFLVGPYLGDQVRHQSPRATLMSSAAPMDPLAVVQIPVARTASLEGDAPASQTARRLRQVENTTTATTTRPTVTPPASTSSGEMLGPLTEEAFAPTSPTTMPVSSGGPLIATETSSAMISSKLENGEPVLTLRIAPFVAPTAPTADVTDPDNAVEATVISAPPSEQALASPAVDIVSAPEREAEPVAPPPAEPQAKPRTRPPALREAAPAPAEPTRKAKPRTTAPARVTTTSAPAPAAGDLEEQLPPAPPPAPDPLNAPYMPSATPTLGADEAPATGAPAPMTPQLESTDGPTPLTMPQD